MICFYDHIAYVAVEAFIRTAYSTLANLFVNTLHIHLGGFVNDFIANLFPAYGFSVSSAPSSISFRSYIKKRNFSFLFQY